MIEIAKIKITKQKKNIRLDSNILVGKDILELVSGAMYVEPLSIYREYVQNAVDAIDEAKEQGLYKGRRQPRIDIFVDPEERTVKIRDNGIGISRKDFVKRLTAFGASHKRGTSARGFRGVGRLSGLGYCQQLIFRTRTNLDTEVSELLWDGKRFKEILLDAKYQGGLNDVVHDVTELSSSNDTSYPAHFFEVELVNVTRYRNDILLNEEVIESYLSQVAPLPFHPEFKYGVEIQKFLDNYQTGKNYPIYLTNINNEDEIEQLYRPHKNRFFITDSLGGRFTGVEYLELPGISGDISACGWILGHGYLGAIPKRELIKGLRLRSGNIQVGSDGIISEVFKEPRFNSWSVGEMHILSKKICPNGRRDDFEANSHYMNLQNHLVPHTSNIAKTCRDSSNRRNRIKAFELEQRKIEENRAVIKQSAVSKKVKENLEKEIERSLGAMNKLTDVVVLGLSETNKLKMKLKKLEGKIDKKVVLRNKKGPLDQLPKHKRSTYREVIDLVYECSPNKESARVLIGKILVKLIGERK